ncbi:MAG: xanthine dehydrogenase molybdopterin binding subunit [Bacteroidetes bacterium GWC2_40_13]|nr:MAG: xanthine dehydrogenase molybdopterin binding subunit [Bacteroidetes bacterium GWC2_40_13]
MQHKVYHESSELHVTGKAVYIDDINVPANTLHGYVVTSKTARGRLLGFDISEALKIPGVSSILSWKDIPGHNQMGAIAPDESVLVEDGIQFVGQALFLIAATTESAAIAASKLIQIDIEELEPVVTLADSMTKGWKLQETVVMKRGDAITTFNHCPHVLQNQLESGAQEHWYLETQVALAVPGEYDEIKVYSSTQHPAETQTLIAEVLGIGRHNVTIETRRLGGAFGGKETQANMVAIWSSLLATATRKPVKLRLFRDDDQKMTGKRHPFLSQFKVGFTNEGKILAYHVSFHANAGYSTDLSMAILARARTHAENAYYIPDILIESTAWKTNLPSNTAFRGFGAPQGIYVIEEAIEQIAQYLKKDAAEIRHLNFYNQPGQTTPYGEVVENNQLETIWKQLIQKSDYVRRKSEVDAFNKKNRYIKKGISLTPVKFGISFNTPFLNQAGALINIYTDGTVLVNHGGIEMGQGLYTKIRQIAASGLGINMEKVRVNATTTSTIPNTSATAASSGTDLNGMAVKNATDKLKSRIASFLRNHWQESCPNLAIEPDGLIFANNTITCAQNPELSISFNEVVKLLYTNRISLSAKGFYSTPNLHFDKETQQGRPFYYYVFGMAVSEVELDLLTGRHIILRTDILHDTGNSINPNIDIGQIEGAFIQGVGWCTTEEIKWDAKGNMLNHSPDTYKIPGVRDIPLKFHVSLLENAPNPNTILQSKAVGEPPFIHALSVFFALKYAVSSVNNHAAYPVLNIPATNEKLVLAIENIYKDMK